MKSTFIIILLLSINTNSFSQTKVESFEFFNDMKGKRIVVADTAILHVGPSAGAAHTDTLFFAENINVLMPVPYFEQVNELDIPWLKITYFKKGFTKVSYILAHQVSLINSIEFENKKWLLAIHSLRNQKAKSLQFLCISDKVIENISTIQLPKDFTFDSIQLFIAEKSCLKNSSAMFNLQLKSNKAEEGIFNKWIVVCENQQLTQLPFIHNYFHQKHNAAIEEYIFFPNQHSFKLSSKILSTKSKETVSKYSWQDCNYTIL